MADAAKAEAWANGNRAASVGEIINFLERYPVWPDRRALVLAAETSLPQGSQPPAGLDKLYADTKPVSLNGFDVYMQYLFQRGENRKAADMIVDRWVNGPLGGDTGDEAAFRRRYATQLSSSDDAARLNRLVWDNERDAAQRMYDRVDAATASLAEARLALQRGDRDATTKLNRVPRQLQDDPALIYARIAFRIENNDTDGAIDLLERNDKPVDRPDLWWKMRNIGVREAIERRNYKQAYKLASRHGLDSVRTDYLGDYTSAEFLAGWLALRFLNSPSDAIAHFKNVNDNVVTAMSKSRGAYWLGRAYESSGDKAQARDWYQQAAVQHAFFYGQLALAKLDSKPDLTIPPDPQIPSNARGAFMAQPLPHLIQAFARQGDTTRAVKYMRTLLASLDTRVEFLLAGDIAKKVTGAPQLEVEVAKAANAKNFILYHAGYPKLHVPEGRVEPALTLGLIRQESQFQDDVVSSAGAVGLMQLLPSSAKGIARKYGIAYSGKSSLYKPATNMAIGRGYLADRIAQFEGSYIIAIAAYNGGQGRVRGWLDTYGDPRIPTVQGGVDPVDWIEMIPIYETRNYVQRVMENTQMYRTLLAGGSAPLRLVDDLRR